MGDPQQWPRHWLLLVSHSFAGAALVLCGMSPCDSLSSGFIQCSCLHSWPVLGHPGAKCNCSMTPPVDQLALQISDRQLLLCFLSRSSSVMSHEWGGCGVVPGWEQHSPAPCSATDSLLHSEHIPSPFCDSEFSSIN